MSVSCIELKSEFDSIILGVRLDGKVGMGKCRIPSTLFKLFGPRAVVSDTSKPIELQEISLSYTNSSITPSTSKALNEYVSRQIEGWIINAGEQIFVSINGRYHNFTVRSAAKSGIVAVTTRVIIEQQDPSVLASIEQTGRVARGFSMVGGLEEVIEELVLNVRKPIQEKQRYLEAGLDPPRGILLFGPPGTGKTLLMRALVDELDEAIIVHKNATDLTGPDCDQRIHRLFSDSRQKCLDSKNNYVVIFVDEFDALCPSRDGPVGEQERRAVAAFLTEMDGLQGRCSNSVQVIVIASTNRPQNIDIALRRPGRFEIEIEVRPPDQRGRQEILRLLACSRFRYVWKPNDADLSKLASLTHGFVGADLQSLISRAALKTMDRDNSILTSERIIDELAHVKPSALRQHTVSIPQTSWSDIGGYENVKEQLIETVVWPTIHSSHFQSMNVDAPKGILLFGPPGCSKTMMARAIATESRMNFVSIKGPEIFSKWVGESEQSIRDLFRVARQASPCVIFFDEIDAIATTRSSDDGGVAGRVLTQLLTEMDGVSSINQVIVVAATNRPQVLDAALLRPGRLDRLIYVGLPDSAARVSIWRSALFKIPHVIPDTGSGSIVELADLTEGYTGAEIVMIAKESAILCIKERIATEESEDLSFKLDELSLETQPRRTHPKVDTHHLMKVLNETHPRTDPELVRALIEFKNKS